ncbi:DNA replication/repair protein RecF [Parendozoicomonas haliclonae]|uniref:DNA replication and repair protein RecF n=1 Tax=Parendozoicomonas haliclonae TaxID=1960125 RepID=A0A1X7AJW1_9GAMM|nr:DNA replication/repair protein RecF [Parendozoicomonas haliclonae]SMA46498.1 DNA replication and repair protein RecF [Parendozoicomonas haliclonae]
MSCLEKISVTDTRNLVSVTLTPSPSINILHGVNGSGKTSFLEAIHLLGTARSFRSTKVKSVIRQGQEACIVFGKVGAGEHSWALGVSRTQDASCKVHINGESARLTSDLAAILPLQVINPDTFRLLEGSPKDRRQFLDWGVFHVEHRFLNAWKRAQKAMKQRNAFLRNSSARHGKIADSLLDVWNVELAHSGEEIDSYRQSYFEKLKPVFEETLAQLTDLSDIQISYTRGWDKESSLREVLDRSLKRDLESGYTHWGPHRADIRIRHKGAPAVESLSRGQQKAVVCALKLAQGKLFSESKAFGCVYLIDDLPSELDKEHRYKLCRMLGNMDAQVFITCVEQGALADAWGTDKDVKMFHVEHGVILEDSVEPAAEASA